MLAQAKLHGVVAGFSDRDEITLAGKIRPEWAACAIDRAPADGRIHSVFTVRSACWSAWDHLTRLACAETESRIAGICLKRRKQAVSLCADIADAEKRRGAELPLDRKLIFLCVGQIVFVPKSRRSADRDEFGPIDTRVRMTRRRICRGRSNRESLTFNVSGNAIHKRCDELGRHWTTVKGSKRSVADFIEVCGAFKCAVKQAPPRANAGFSGASG